MLALVMPPRPEPEKTVPAEQALERLGAYEALANELGVRASSLLGTRVLEFMAREGIPFYKQQGVTDFLDALTLKTGESWAWWPLRETDRLRAPHRPDGYILRSKPDTRRLRQFAALFVAAGIVAVILAASHSTARIATLTIGAVSLVVGAVCAAVALMAIGNCYSAGYTFNDRRYTKLIPIEHLRNMKKLADAFPELSFFVSDIVSDPDPFIMCTTHDGWRVVFGVWDEPGYGKI